jgi:CheY-like chemotaxis protein
VSSYLQVPCSRTHDRSDNGRRPVAVLVVDDDDLKRYTLNRLLSPLGYDIVEAESGPAALRCLLVQDFAVVLLDIRLPGMDGFEVARLIRSRRRSHLTPIMLTTASTRDEIVTSGLFGDKVTDFMFAPVDSEAIRTTVMVFGNLFLKEQELLTQAHEAQASAERWRLRTDAAPVGIFQTDRHDRYTYTNPRWSDITGIPAETALGQDWWMIVDAEQASTFIGPGPEGTLRSEAPHLLTLHVPGAAPKVVLLSWRHILDADGESAGWAGSVTDVTHVTDVRQNVAASSYPDQTAGALHLAAQPATS